MRHQDQEDQLKVIDQINLILFINYLINYN